jgi:hypothetical protein
MEEDLLPAVSKKSRRVTQKTLLPGAKVVWRLIWRIYTY